MSLRGVFGGTFDPIHLGHLRCAWEVAESLDMPVHMVPARVPPHRRPPIASAGQRWEMLSLALAGQGRLLADDRELQRPGPSYMVDTLDSIAAEFPGEALCLILGSDAAGGLERWHRWREVLERAHLLVLTRPGEPAGFPTALATLLSAREVRHPEELAAGETTAMLRFPVTALEISASRIRRQWRAGKQPWFLSPRPVHEYIARHRIYADLPAEH